MIATIDNESVTISLMNLLTAFVAHMGFELMIWMTWGGRG